MNTIEVFFPLATHSPASALQWANDHGFHFQLVPDPQQPGVEPVGRSVITFSDMTDTVACVRLQLP